MELRGAQVTTGGRCNSRAYAPVDCQPFWLLAFGKTVPPYHPSWQHSTLWNGSGTLRPTHYVCYLPEAKGGHAKHVVLAFFLCWVGFSRFLILLFSFPRERVFSRVFFWLLALDRQFHRTTHRGNKAPSGMDRGPQVHT